MKSKNNPFRSSATRGAAVVFACFGMLNPSVQAADQLWTGLAGDQNVNTAGNWVAAPDLFSFSPIVFGSDVVNGTMELQPWVTVQGLTVNSGCTTPITINGGWFLFANGAPIDLSSAGADLTMNVAWMQGWGDISMNVGAGRTLTLNGALGMKGGWAGNAGLVKNGAGKAVLNAGPVTTAFMPNPTPSDGYYTGPTSINAGTLSVTYNGSGNGGIGTLPVGSSITVSSGATLLASGFNALGYASTHAGDQLTIDKGGSLTIDAGVVASMPYALNVVGGTIASVDGGNPGLGTLYYQSTQGTFTSAGDGTPATISAQNFNLQGAQFNVTDGAGAVDLNVTGNLIGGPLTKNGNGIMALSTVGAVGYTGATTVNSGTLIMPSGDWQLNGIASYPITVNAGATLQLPANPSEYAAAPTLNGGTITSSGVNVSGWPTITLDANLQITAGGAAVSTIATSVGVTANTTFSVGSGSTLNMTGPILEAFIAARTGVIKTDAGTLALSSAANNYDCDTTISGGTLALGGAGQLNGGNYGYNIINNAALVYGSSANQTLSGVISGAGSLTKDTSNSTLYLSGANTNSGASIVSAGVLKYANVAAVGSTSGITVNNTGSVWFDPGTAGGTVTTPISLSGDGGGNCALNNYIANNSQTTFSGPITLTGSSLIRGFGDNSTMNFTNAIHGTGDLSFAAFSGGAGTKNFLVLSGASDFSGGFALVNWFGAVQATLSGGDNRLPTTALVTVRGGGGMAGALDLNGNNQTIAGLTDTLGFGSLDAGARSVVNTSGTGVTLTLNTTADQSSGASVGGTDINGTAGNNLALLKSGNATQTLSGANTYSGNTTVTGGILSLGQVNSNNESSTVSIAATAGAKLDLGFAGTDTVGSLYINGAQQPAGNYTNAHPSGAFTGGGTLQVASGPAGYATWKAVNAPTGTPNDDYDGDGASNGVEFVLGGTKDTNDLSKLPAISTSGTDMVFSFQRTQASIDGTTTVVIQVGTDLSSWPDTYTVLGTAQVNNPGVTIQKDNPSVGTDTVILTVPRASAPTKFARLVVTPAP